MDSNHKLDAPNNETLRTIDQIEDRSGLGSLYREAAVQFEGEILSAADREKAKADKLEALTSGLGKSSLKIGLLVPYPFVSGALLGAGLYMLTPLNNAWILVAGIFVAGIFWLVTSYKAYASIFKTFYNHALRAGPFLFVMLVSLILALQGIYWLVSTSLSSQSLALNTAIVSLLLVTYSLLATFILLGIWGNSRLASGFKLLASTLILTISAVFAVSSYLF